MRSSVGQLGLGLLLLGCAAGCKDYEGRWALSRVDASGSAEAVHFTTITLDDDGTFRTKGAEPGYGPTSGTYTVSGGTLTLRNTDGATFTYDVELVRGGSKMRLVSYVEGRPPTVIILDRRLIKGFDR